MTLPLPTSVNYISLSGWEVMSERWVAEFRFIPPYWYKRGIENGRRLHARCFNGRSIVTRQTAHIQDLSAIILSQIVIANHFRASCTCFSNSSLYAFSLTGQNGERAGVMERRFQVPPPHHLSYLSSLNVFAYSWVEGKRVTRNQSFLGAHSSTTSSIYDFCSNVFNAQVCTCHTVLIPHVPSSITSSIYLVSYFMATIEYRWG